MIIGLTGRKQAGKSTVAVELRSRGFIETSFAAPIRHFTCALLGIDFDELEIVKEKPIDWLPGVTPRRIMQTLGTEWGRESIHPELWVLALKNRARGALERGDDLVISDVRFDNEARAIHELGGIVVNIERPGVAVDDHKSERGVSRELVQYHVLNNGGLSAIADVAERIIIVGRAFGGAVG